jgi:hypothetical protein
MKKIISSAVVLSSMVLASSSWAAESASTAVDVSGNAPKICTGAIGNTLAFGADLVDPLDNKAKASPKTSTADIMCNYKAFVSLKSAKGHMTDPAITSAPTGFDNFVDYTATAAWGGVTAELDADGSAVNLTSPNQQIATTAANDTLTLTVTPIKGDILIASDNYTDTLTVQVGADL